MRAFVCLALAGTLLLSSPIYSQETGTDPKQAQCANGIRAFAGPFFKLALVGGSLVGGGVAASYYLVPSDATWQIATTGVLFLGWQAAFEVARRIGGRQLDTFSESANTWGYSVNDGFVAWVFNRSRRTGWLGDRVSPNLHPHRKGRLNTQKQDTADTIGTVDTHFSWLGVWVYQYLKSGEFDNAAQMIVSNGLRLSYAVEEVLVATLSEHREEMVKQLCKNTAFANLYVKLRKFFKQNPDKFPEFLVELQIAIDEQAELTPLPFEAYAKGMDIFFNEWLAPAFKKHLGLDLVLTVPHAPARAN